MRNWINRLFFRKESYLEVTFRLVELHKKFIVVDVSTHTPEKDEFFGNRTIVIGDSISVHLPIVISR